MSFPVWLVGWFCFVLLRIIHLSSLSSRMPLSHSLLFAAPGCSRFFENATFGGPEFTMTLLFPAVVTSLPFPWGRNSMSPGSVPRPPIHYLNTPTPSLCLLGISSRWWHKTEQWCPLLYPELWTPPAPKNFNQLPFFSFPFPLLALDANPWTIENYPLF